MAQFLTAIDRDGGATILKINGKSYRAHRAEQAPAGKRPKK